MSGLEDPAADRRFATTLARGLSVLRAFRPSDQGLGNGEIARRTGLAKSTVSRLTFTLASLGYLTHSARDLYRPGPALLVLGNTAAVSIPFVELAGPILQRLADGTRTLGLLLVRDGDRMLIVRTWRPRGVASLWLEVGHRLPLDGTSSGAALLAALPDAAFEALDGAADLRAARRDAAGQAVGRGFVIVDPARYFAPGIHAVAVPFHPPGEAEPVVFTCGAPPDMLPEDRMAREVGPALATAVGELRMLCGGTR